MISAIATNTPLLSLVGSTQNRMEEQHRSGLMRLTIAGVYGVLIVGGFGAGGVIASVRGDEPARVEARGEPINIEQGGAAPFFADFDGDRLPDLLLGQSDGKLRIYINHGTNEHPSFDAYEMFKAGDAGDAGQVIPSPDRNMIGGAVGFVPQVVDFDGDGLQDVLSCTGNGALVVFSRREDGSFAQGESLKRADGLEIAGFPGTAMFAGDWDGDGDLDLVLTIQRAGLSLLRNEGSRGEQTFGVPEAFKADDEPVQVRYGAAAPAMADWDGDGLVDLIVGGEDGSVTVYRHTGAAQDVSVEEGKVLVPRFWFDEEDRTPRPGRFAHPCVCDFNGDGRLDLLVGSGWTSVETPEVTLSDAERDHDAAVEKKLSALSKKFAAERKALERETGSAREKRLEFLRVISSQMRAMRREQMRPPPDPIVTSSGQVWVYLSD